MRHSLFAPFTPMQGGHPIFKTKLRAIAIALATLVLTFIVSQSAHAQTFTVIYNFTGGADGANPATGLTIDKTGTLYGTTFRGASGYGGVFSLKHSRSRWTLNPLYSFTGGNDGALPYFGRVVIGLDGSLYGTTLVGGGGSCQNFGVSGCGTVFELKPQCKSQICSWTETVLYRFTAGTDGAFPDGNPVLQAGDLYLTTAAGGDNGGCFGYGCGTIFKLAHSNGRWKGSVLYALTNNSSIGCCPYGGVTFDRSGNLYSTAALSGTSQVGAVIQLTPSESGWTEHTLYDFQGGNDGGVPYVGLIFDTSGHAYGATSDFGSRGGGTVFELRRSNGVWKYTVLHSFAGSNEVGPYGDLIMDQAGNLYGTTEGGGSSNCSTGCGRVFKLTRSHGGWVYSSLHNFTGGNDGANPFGSSLVFDVNGNLYGTAAGGGKHGKGVVFMITQ